MVFADASRCPDCGAALGGGTSCPACRLDLTSEAARRLWKTLQEADDLLEQARASRVPGPAAAAAVVPPLATATGDSGAAGPTEATAGTAGPVLPEPTTPRPTTSPPSSPPPSTPSPGAPLAVPFPAQPPRGPKPGLRGPRRRRVSAGTVLLALGALSLVVAGSIFIGVYWGPMGILGRALVLLAVTLLVGALATLVTRRRLRSSAEALWTVFLALLSLDWLAARDQGLFGLDDAPAAPVELAWALVTVGLATAAVRLGRRHLAAGAGDGPAAAADGAAAGPPVTLVAPSVIAGLAVVHALVRRSPELADAGVPWFWALVVVAVALGAGAAALGVLRMRVGAAIAGVVAVGHAGVAVVVAVAQAVLHPSLEELTTGGQGVPLLVVVLALVAGVVVARRVGDLLVTVLTVPAVLAAALLVTLPAADAWDLDGAVVVLGLVLVACCVPTAGAVARGSRWAAVAPGSVVVAVLLADAVALPAAVAGSVDRSWGADLTDPLLLPRELDPVAWRVAVSTLAVVLALVLLRRSLGQAAPWVRPAAALVGAGGALVVVASLEAPAAVLAAVTLLAGLAVGWSGRRWSDVVSLAGAAAVVLAPVIALESQVACVLVWPAAALSALVLARRHRLPQWRDVLVAAAVVWSAAAVGAAVLLAGADDVAVVWALALVATLVAAASAGSVRAADGRIGAEVAAGAVAAWSLLQGAAVLGAGGFAALALGLAGVLVALTALARDRRWYAAAAGALAVVAVPVTAGTWPDAVWAWPAAGLVLGACAHRLPAGWVRDGAAALATLALAGSVVPPTVLLELPDVMGVALLLAAGLVALYLAAMVVPSGAGARGVEAAGAVVGVLAVLLAGDLPLLDGVVVVLAAAGLLLVLAVLTRAGHGRVRALSAAAVTLLPVTASAEQWEVAVWTWPAGAVLVGLAAALVRRGAERTVVAGVAGLLVAVCGLPPAELAQLATAPATLVLLVSGLAVLAVALLVLQPRRGGDGVEAAGGAVALWAVLVGVAETGPAHVALLLTVLGAMVAALSLLVPRRRHYRWVAVAALGVAYVLRLVASDVGVVEAYTLPFGVALLALGVWVTERPPEGTAARPTVVTLGPGLLLSLLPSLPLAVDDPSSLRALLLGVGALAVLAAGVVRRWQAPTVAGAVVVVVVVLANVGPYAWGLPRWVLIAVAGAVMLGTGVTWEQRVRDGRAAARWVGAMR